MEEYPVDLVMLMDELSPVDFCKLAFYKLNKMKIETIHELVELEKVMCKAMDLSTKMKLGMLSPALRERFFKVLAEKGLDKPPSLLANIAVDYSKMPFSGKRESPIFLEENQPKLFQNTSKPSDTDPNTYKPAQKPGQFLPKSEPISPSLNSNREQDLYKSGMLELDSIKQGPGKDVGGRAPPKSFREESLSPPRAYKSRARSQSRPRERETRRSRTPPPYKRSSSRPRRSRTRSPPSVRSYSRFDDRKSRSPPSSRSFSRRSRSPRRSPPSPRSFSARRASPSRRSRSPPSTRSFSRRSRSPPSTRSFSRKSRSPPSVREVRKDDDEEGGARKGGLSFSLAPRKKVPVLEKPSFKF